MSHARSRPSNGNGTASREEALLDQVVEAALDETVSASAKTPRPVRAPDDGDDVETILRRAAILFRSRPDREQLLDRLRTAVTAAPEETPPEEPASAEASGDKPE